MKVGSILSLSAFLTGNKKLADKITEVLNKQEVFTKEEKEQVGDLLKCYNITVSELSDEYLPLTYKEDLTSADKRYYYKDFSKQPLEIKSVYRSDIPLKFNVYPTYFTTSEEECTVVYEYLCKPCADIEDESEFTDTVLSERVIAEGIVSEYLINTGMYEEAILWRDRYIKSLQSCLLKRKINKIKPRGWY